LFLLFLVSLRNSEEASQSSPRTDKADTTPSRYCHINLYFDQAMVA